MAPGVPQLYGHSYDPDALGLPSVESYKTIVLRRSPAWSRPPGNFVRVWKGGYYTVWRREGPAPLLHVPLGGSFEPAAVLPCRRVGRLAADAARQHARILAAPRASNISVDLGTVNRSSLVGASVDLEGRPQLVFIGPGRIQGGLRVTRPGRYALWLGGDVDRPLHVYLDGRLVGSPTRQSGDDGTMIGVAVVSLSAGNHSITLLRGGGDLRPDDNGSTVLDGIVFEPVGNQAATVSAVEPQAWRSLCGRTLDWLELTR